MSMFCPSLLRSQNRLFVLMSFSTSILSCGLGFTPTQRHTKAALMIQAKFRRDQARKCVRRIQAEVLGEMFVYI